MTKAEAGKLGGLATAAKHGGLDVCSECGQLKPPYYATIASKQSIEDKRKGGKTTASRNDMVARGKLGGRPRGEV